ncbi:hypothetical protein CEXT_137511 [Caerostris extrusa]|uniref:Secreted protein n=1 Tax=Caerostris extrusa TaxID=172846 RepID=A0AAV4RG54_CAEEX|nr:hypothetical protein CEXT_137511 [Caerostris extrusa]
MGPARFHCATLLFLTLERSGDCVSDRSSLGLSLRSYLRWQGKRLIIPPSKTSNSAGRDRIKETAKSGLLKVSDIGKGRQRGVEEELL